MDVRTLCPTHALLHFTHLTQRCQQTELSTGYKWKNEIQYVQGKYLRGEKALLQALRSGKTARCCYAPNVTQRL